jgi:hypothetical protein
MYCIYNTCSGSKEHGVGTDGPRADQNHSTILLTETQPEQGTRKEKAIPNVRSTAILPDLKETVLVADTQYYRSPSPSSRSEELYEF